MTRLRPPRPLWGSTRGAPMAIKPGKNSSTDKVYPRALTDRSSDSSRALFRTVFSVLRTRVMPSILAFIISSGKAVR